VLAARLMHSGASQASNVASISATSSVARVASLATLAGTGFLAAYMLFHALHVAGRDPLFVKSLSAIPLFSTCEAAGLVGLAVGLSGSLAVLDHDRLLVRMSKILAVTIVLFTFEIVFFP
jgi:hypothetical protein